MALGDRQARKLIARVQPLITEPVLGAALLSPKGRQAAMAISFGAVGGVESKVAPGFASYNVVAYTDHALYAFKADTNFGTSIKDPIGWWPWGAFGASTSTAVGARYLTLGWVDGSTSELEAHTVLSNQFQGKVIEEIVRRAAVAGGIPPRPA